MFEEGTHTGVVTIDSLVAESILRDVLAQPLFEFLFHFFFDFAQSSFSERGCKVGWLVLLLKL